MGLIVKGLFQEDAPKPDTDGRFLAAVVAIPVTATAAAFALATAHAVATIPAEDICTSEHAGAKVLCMTGYG